MTENTPESSPQLQRVVMLTPAQAAELEKSGTPEAPRAIDGTDADVTDSGTVLPFPAPADADDADAIGYGVYDRQLGQYVGGVVRGTDDKAKAKARSSAKGDQLVVVKV